MRTFITCKYGNIVYYKLGILIGSLYKILNMGYVWYTAQH